MARKRQVPLPVPPIQTEDVELLDIPAVAKRLKISRAKVYRLINEEGLPRVIVGSVARISLVSLRQWIVAHEQAS